MGKSQKPLNVWTLGFMNVAIVASLQMMTSCAVYGASLIFFYFIAILAFFLPCLFIISDLVVESPVNGGSYIWVERAFGKEWGFFTVCIQWLCNLIWYPTIFSLIATSLAYFFSPELSTNKTYILVSMLGLFWGVTLLNSFGIKVSGWWSALSAILGVIVPTLILITLGIVWMVGPHQSQITFTLASILPNLKDSSQLAFLTQVIISLIGLEMAFVHAGDVRDPSRNIPRALVFSAILILLIVILAPLSIALVIPSDQISVIGGLFDAFKAFFAHFNLPQPIYLAILALIFIGNCGNVTAWMISSTRGMHVACEGCNMPAFLRKTNRYDAPVGVLVFEAILFSAFAAFFLFFETLSNSYWILLTLASQVALIYYLFIFAAAVKIKRSSASGLSAKGVQKTTIAAVVAGAVTLVTIGLGFFPPEQGSVSEGAAYPLLLAGGLVTILILPFAMLKSRRYILSAEQV